MGATLDFSYGREQPEPPSGDGGTVVTTTEGVGPRPVLSSGKKCRSMQLLITLLVGEWDYFFLGTLFAVIDDGLKVTLRCSHFGLEFEACRNWSFKTLNHVRLPQF